MTIADSAHSGRHSLADRGEDLYQTPPAAVKALQRVEHLPPLIWEPACGPGAIATVLREAGHTVFATDLVNYYCPNSLSGVDFLMERRPPPGCSTIVTNPPFKLALEFVEHAIMLCPRVIMLLRLGFLEGGDDGDLNVVPFGFRNQRKRRRSAVLDGGKLSRVYVFRNRLPMMHREGWEGPRIKSSAVAFCWYVWDWNTRGPTQLFRITA